MMIQALYSNFQSILIDSINKHSSTLSGEGIFERTTKYIDYIMLLSVVIVVCSQLFYHVMVTYYVKGYAQSSPIFAILAGYNYFYGIYVVLSALLFSKAMEKEKYGILICAASVVGAVLLDGLFIWLGLKGEGIALGTTLSQAVMTGVSLWIFVRHTEHASLSPLAKMCSITGVFVVYNTLFYYLVSRGYPIAYGIACAVVVLSVLFVMTERFYRFNTYATVMGMLKGGKQELPAGVEV
jgi:hypothetical protein